MQKLFAEKRIKFYSDDHATRHVYGNWTGRRQPEKLILDFIRPSRPNLSPSNVGKSVIWKKSVSAAAKEAESHTF